MANARHPETIAWGLLVLLALALRLVDLGDRPYHHDEAQVAYFSWVLLERGGYEYDPLLHGPFNYYATALAQLAAGAGDFSSRLPPAVLGAATTALPWVAREQIGRIGAWSAGALLALSPTALYYSRFAHTDTNVGVFEMAVLVVLLRALALPARWQPPTLGALLALAFATKETTFIFVALLVPFLVVVVVRDRELRRRLRALGPDPWLLAAALFLAIHAALFSSLFSSPGGVIDGWIDGPRYWLAQHDVRRGGEHWSLYALILIGYELVIVVLALYARRPGLLVWMAAASVVAYSVAGERFAWLALHPLLPLALLAGVGVQRLWVRRPLVLAVVALAALAYTGWSSLRVNALHPTDPRELLVTTQSHPDVKAVVRAAGQRPVVDSSEGGGFPWAWYLRDRLRLVDMTSSRFDPRGEVLIAGPAAAARFGPDLDGYRSCEFVFRIFWGRQIGALTLDRWLRWMAKREPWNPVGDLRGRLYLELGPDTRCPDG